VADAPGWKSLALWDTYPEEVDAYFPEIAPLVEECKFSDCSHTHEPGCAVVKAVAGGVVSEQRYDSYLRLRSGQE
jgi:ribosome biogenesis GTPase